MILISVCVYVLFAFDRLGESDWSISAGTREEEENDMKIVDKNTMFTYDTEKKKQQQKRKTN